jgi:predicted O-linked N-acetylglucosamine transferase (SPINDLY family)
MADARLSDVDALLRRGDAAGARALADTVLAETALAARDRSVALMLRSRAHEQLRNLPAAIADVEGALALNPADARACNELGILCIDAQQRDRAIDAFRRATRLDPLHARAWNNLGTALREAGRLDEARDAFSRAARADPRYALASANLGIALRDLSKDAEAVQAFRAALAIDPGHRLALTALAGLRRAEGHLDEAASLYERALTVDARDALTWLLYAGTLAERDDLDAAISAFEQAAQRDRKLLRAVFGRWLTLPMIPQSAQAVVEHRRAFAQGLANVEGELRSRIGAMDAPSIVDEVRWTNFLLAYQGENDRELQVRFAAIIGNAIDAADPALRAPLPKRHRGSRRLRIGFVSSLFRDGTVGRYFEHWITDLPREAFEVHVFALQSGFDAVAQRISQRADRYHPCPRFRPSQVASRIRDSAPDVLVYPELGMDATTFAVAALRLAPMQVAAWGHPVTTGHATVDVFFTSGAMEPPDGDSHYSEQLVRLPGIGTRYLRPDAPDAASREAIGLPREGVLFLCPQSLFKISPDDDAMFARVLAATPGSRLVFFEGRHARLTAKFVTRLHAALATQGVAAADRILFQPQCSHDAYLRLNRACDAMLDTLRWSGGNTTLDAIACGLPVVTLPGRYMRARQSAAMLELAGVPELVSRDLDDYLRIASTLASDAGWRDDVSRRLVGGHARIFDDPSPLAAFASWLLANA